MQVRPVADKTALDTVVLGTELANIGKPILVPWTWRTKAHVKSAKA